jgi:hypothetical protein
VGESAQSHGVRESRITHTDDSVSSLALSESFKHSDTDKRDSTYVTIRSNVFTTSN